MFDLLAHNQFNTSIWGDEGFSAILSFKSFPEIIKIIITDTSPPLWNITERLAFLTFGTSEVVIRGLAFFYFLLTIFFVYKIGDHLWERRTGLVAAALTFLNPFFFIYAFEGRMYSILALGVTASMYFFLKRNYVGYVIATLWALYSHHFAIFALFVQGIWFLYEVISKQKERAKKRFKAFLAIGLFYLPWLYPLYLQTSKVGGGFWLGKPDLHDLKVLIYDYLAQGIKTDTLSLPFTTYKLYEVALYLVFAVLILRRWHKSIKNTLFLLLWFLGPILMTWLVSQYFTSIFYNRYLLYSIPAAMLILASKGQKYSGYVVGVLLIVFGIIDFQYFTHPTKLPFKEMGAYVEETRQPNDFFINADGGSHHLWETKYYGFNAPIYIPDGGELPYFVGTALMEPDDIISEIPSEVTRLGVVTSKDTNSQTIPAGFVETDRKEIRELKLIWFEKLQETSNI